MKSTPTTGDTIVGVDIIAVVIVTIIVEMVSGAQIEVRNRLIRVAPDVIVFFIGIVGIIVVNTIHQIIEQTEASQHIIL
jgi:hypothetical protein